MQLKPIWYKSRFLNISRCYFNGSGSNYCRILDLAVSTVKTASSTTSVSTWYPNFGSSLLSYFRVSGQIGGGDKTTSIDKVVRSIDTRSTLSDVLQYGVSGAGRLNNKFQCWSCGGDGSYSYFVQKLVFNSETTLTISGQLPSGRLHSGSYLSSYVVGGENTSNVPLNTSIKFLNNVETFSSLSSTLTTARTGCPSGGNNHFFLCISGRDSSWNRLTSVEKLVTSTDTFSVWSGSWPVSQYRGAAINTQLNLWVLGTFTSGNSSGYDVTSVCFSTETPTTRTSLSFAADCSTGDISFQI